MPINVSFAACLLLLLALFLLIYWLALRHPAATTESINFLRFDDVPAGSLVLKGIQTPPLGTQLSCMITSLSNLLEEKDDDDARRPPVMVQVQGNRCRILMNGLNGRSKS